VTHAAITGWGKCLPPNVLTNADLATFLDTNDEWITSRTGISERRISHVSLEEMAYVSSMRALAAAGLDPADVELIVIGTCSFDDQVPNQASGLQVRLGAKRAAAYDVNTACTSFLYALSTANALIRTGAAAYDVNTACTSFLYALSTANALIRTGVVKNAVVVGGELISAFMDWHNRGVCVLFGDGCAAVVLEATDKVEGLLGEKLGCDSDARNTLVVKGMGGRYVNQGRPYGETSWIFEGPEIFKRAVLGMSGACSDVLAAQGYKVDDVDVVIPHQANLRIMDAVAKRVGAPADRMFVNVHKYGNMSAATVAVALVEAIEEGWVKPNSLLLLPGFGAGLTWCAHLVRWGERTTPIGTTDVDLPPSDRTALEIVQGYLTKAG